MKRCAALDEADRAAEVHAARGDRDEAGRTVGLRVAGDRVDRRVVLAHVDGRLAGLADAGGDRDRLRDVGVVRGSRRPGRRPARARRASRRSGRARSRARAAGTATAAIAPAAWTLPVMKRRRVTVSPSKAPGILRSSGVLALGCLRSATRPAAPGDGNIIEANGDDVQGAYAPATVRAPCHRTGAPRRAGPRRRDLRARGGLRGLQRSPPQPTAAAPASQAASASSGSRRRGPARTAR